MKNTDQYLFLVEIINYPSYSLNREGIKAPLLNFTSSLNIVSPSAEECILFVQKSLDSLVLSINKEHGVSFKEKHKITNCAKISKVDAIS